MLACPRCASKLTAVRYARTLAWRCPRCRGHAVNYAVLRRGLPEPRWTALRLGAVASRRPGTARCPSCRKPTRGLDDDGIELDACHRCQLFWFDPEELERLPRRRLRKETLTLAERHALARRRTARADKEELTGWQILCGFLGLPYELDPQPREAHPWATIALTLAVIVCGLLSLADPAAALAFGFVPDDPWRGSGLTILTCFFVHAGLLHLFGNAYFLAVFGDNVEEALGAGRFLLLTAFGTVAGALTHAEFDPRPGVPIVGASAGISALLAYYAVAFPRARIGWALRLFHVPVWWFRFHAWVAILLWLGLQVALAVSQAAGMTDVSAFAHLGGAGAGLLFWIVQRTMNS